MLRRIPGVRPREYSLRSKHQKGFTLVEVMMSVVLMGIGMALAIPSYREMVEKRQLTNGAEQLIAFVNSTQGIASRTNQVVTVSWSRTDSDDWCVGAVLGATACDCTQTSSVASDYCAIDGEKFVIDNSHTSNREMMHAVSGSGSYAFDPIRGLFTNPDDSMEMELRSQSGDYRLKLLVNNVGKVNLCSEDSAHSIPGYGICPAVVEESL